jgi:hypothetical protein
MDLREILCEYIKLTELVGDIFERSDPFGSIKRGISRSFE